MSEFLGESNRKRDFDSKASKKFENLNDEIKSRAFFGFLPRKLLLATHCDSLLLCSSYCLVI